MKKAIGGVYIYNLVIIFLLIMFGFIMASISYTKAFKVSKSIAAIIERSAGYNSVSIEKINAYLSSIGYQRIKLESCPTKKGKNAIRANGGTPYPNGICVYEVDGKTAANDKYITYGITSYMTIDLPLINLIKIPIYIETEKIYIFS
ncbi:MAG: hypothetical protein IJB71_00405 [Bacilli bacterium]|nr:hypothetical protein [Bacilli bacterium]